MSKGDAVLNQTMQAIEEKAIDASKKLRCAIVGTGWIAEAHVPQYLKFPDVELVAMCDIVPGKCEKFCKRRGVDYTNIHFYENLDEMLAKENLDSKFSTS